MNEREFQVWLAVYVRCIGNKGIQQDTIPWNVANEAVLEYRDAEEQLARTE